MVTAWLKQSNGTWKKSTDVDAILDHQGQIVWGDPDLDCADQAELAIGQISVLEGKFAYSDGWRVTLHDRQVVPSFDMVKKRIQNGETVRVERLDSHWRQVKMFKTAYSFNSECAGFVAASVAVDATCHGQTYMCDVSYDPELYAKLARRWKSEQKKRELTNGINCYMMRRIANELCASMGIRDPNGFLVAHFIVFITSHDAVMGRRATNKILIKFARLWAANAKVWKKHYGQWMGDRVDTLDKRLRCIVKFPEAAKS